MVRTERVFVRTLLLAMALSSVAAAGRAEEQSLQISQVHLVDLDSGRVSRRMTVVVANGQIAAVRPSDSAQGPKAGRVVDGAGGYLIPGLWDTHVHLSIVGRSALPALVANGVTTVRDMGSRLADIDAWIACAGNEEWVAPDIVRAGPILNGREFHEYQLAVTDPQEARMAVRTLRKVGVDFIKVHRRVSRDAYFAIAEETKRLGMSFVGHVPIEITPREASDAGQTTLEHVETLFEGTFAAGSVTPAAIEQWRRTQAEALFGRFVENHTRLTPTLVTWSQILKTMESSVPDLRDRYVSSSAKAFGEKLLASLRAMPQKELTEELATQRALFRELKAVVAVMHSRGVPLLTGTDLAVGFIYPGFSVHDELELLVQTGLSPLDALRAATANPAELFPSMHAGAIAPGGRANLVLLERNPLQDINAVRGIRAVVLRGRLYDRGALDRLLERAAELAQESESPASADAMASCH